MNKLFEAFPKPSKEAWIELLTKELKGADFQKSLVKFDEIEGIEYPSFFHQDDVQLAAEVPGKFPYKRGFFSELNDWSIVGEIEVKDAKKANKKALDLLMKGNTALHFEFTNEDIDLEILFKEIGFEYIKVYFTVRSEILLKKIKIYFQENKYDELFFNQNPMAERKDLHLNDFIQLKKGLTRNFEVDAYSFQQAGANCSEEIAFALSLGHEYVAQQIKLGRSVDDALLNVHFTFGVGSNFLFEIAKLRAFRLLWSKITRSYKPEHKCNETLQLTSKTGFLNKSLQDPYTNLLRQTTEVMSAVLGGANHIINQAYDKNSMQNVSEFAERMASNISLILKEESYLNEVLDAVGGSYAIESLTDTLADKAWKLFQEMEAQAGVFSESLIEKVKETAQKRISLHAEKKKTLIGITKFPNPDKSDLIWKKNSSLYFGLPELIIEEKLKH